MRLRNMGCCSVLTGGESLAKRLGVPDSPYFPALAGIDDAFDRPSSPRIRILVDASRHQESAQDNVLDSSA